MNRPITSSRIFLVAGRPTAPSGAQGAVKRYRLARLQPGARPDAAPRLPGSRSA